MKTFIVSSYVKLLFFMVMTLLISCNNKVDLALNDPINFEYALDNYNKSRSLGSHEGLVVGGQIRIEKHVDGKERKLVCLVNGKDVFRKYQFQYDIDQKEVNIPKLIEAGKTVYLGDNLVIYDLKNQNYYSFVVDGYKNRVSDINPTYGNGLISVIIDNESTLIRSGGACTCSCTRCMNCDNNPFCGTAMATCNCGGNSQSVTCRDCFEASCTSCTEK